MATLPQTLRPGLVLRGPGNKGSFKTIATQHADPWGEPQWDIQQFTGSTHRTTNNVRMTRQELHDAGFTVIG